MSIAARANRYLNTGDLSSARCALGDLSQGNIFQKIIYRSLCYLGLIHLLDSWLRSEQLIDTVGISRAMESFFRDYLVDVRVEGIENLPKRGPLLIVGLSHDCYIEPLLLSSVIKRDDMRLIAVYVFRSLGKNFGKHILPVLPKKHAVDRKKFLKLSNPLNLMQGIYEIHGHTLSSIESMNKESLGQAVELLRQGRTVMLFPAGGAPLHAKWQRGLSMILQSMGVDAVQTPMVPIHVEGLNRWNVWRHVFRVSHRQSTPLKITVKVGEPLFRTHEMAAKPDFLENLRLEVYRNLVPPTFSFRFLNIFR